MYSVEYLPTTSSDFNDIVHFYKNVLKNKSYAQKITKKIRYSIEELRKSPERCASYPFKSKNPQYPSPDIYVYRKLVVENYSVLYTVDHKLKKIIIARIFDGRSNYQSNM